MTSEIPYRSFSAEDSVLSCDPWVWVLASRDEYSRYCAFCFTERQDLRTCSKCKLHRYCDAECQTADWKLEHRVECSMLESVDTYRNILRPSAGQRGLMPVILMSKIALKLERTTRNNLGELGTKTARELLDSLPTYPENEKLRSFFEFRSMDKIHPRHLFPTFNPFCMQFSFADFVKIIECNTFPVLDPSTKENVIGAAVVAQATFRAMTPVCWDSNVIIDFRGRKFVVYATEDIAQYTGLHELRYSELLDDPSFLAPTERRRLFQQMYNRSCDCRKCTSAYEAEINPLRCVTPGCTERVPSDDRALAPCPQSGAVSKSDILQQVNRFVNKLEKTRKRSRLQGSNVEADYAAETALREEIDAAGILHGDAHIRFLVGWHEIDNYASQGRIVEAWGLCRELTSCVREIISRYHTRRADFLMEAGLCFGRLLRQLRDMEKDAVTRQEARQMLSDLLGNSISCLNICEEACEINRKICGEDSKRARDARQCYEIIEDTKREMTETIRLNENVVIVTERSNDILAD